MIMKKKLIQVKKKKQEEGEKENTFEIKDREKNIERGNYWREKGRESKIM